jgi:hypothetical protein
MTIAAPPALDKRQRGGVPGLLTANAGWPR